LQLEFYLPDWSHGWKISSAFVQNARNLQRLTLTEARIGISFALAIAELPNLCWLHLDECEINADFQEYIQGVEPGHIPAMPALRHAELSFPLGATNPVDFASWGILTLCGPSLQRLELQTFRFICPDRADWPHYTRPLRALRHLEIRSIMIEGDVPRLIEFLCASAPLALNKFEIRDPNLQAGEIKILVGQLNKLSPSLSIININLSDAALMVELRASYPSIGFGDFS